MKGNFYKELIKGARTNHFVVAAPLFFGCRTGHGKHSHNPLIWVKIIVKSVA